MFAFTVHYNCHYHIKIIRLSTYLSIVLVLKHEMWQVFYKNRRIVISVLNTMLDYIVKLYHFVAVKCVWSACGMLLFRCLVHVHWLYLHCNAKFLYISTHMFWEDKCCIIFNVHTSNKNQPITAQHLCKQTIFSHNAGLWYDNHLEKLLPLTVLGHHYLWTPYHFNTKTILRYVDTLMLMKL